MNNIIYYKHYKTLLLTVSGLLLGCTILIAFLQIKTQQEKKVFEIEERVIEKAMVFDNFMNDHIKGLQQLQHVFHLEFENYLQTDIQHRFKNENNAFQLILDSLNSEKREVSLLGKGNINTLSKEQMHEIRVGYALKSSLEAVSESNQDIEKVYYVSDNQWIMTYPYRQEEEFDLSIYKGQFYVDVKHDKNINKVIISSIWYKNNVKMLSVGYPIYFKNSFKGMLAIDIKLAAFQKLLDSFMVQYNPTILILKDKKDLILSDYPENTKEQNNKEIVATIQKNKKTAFSNNHQYIFLRNMLNGEWQFVYIVQKDNLMSVLLQPIFEIFVVVLIFVLFLIAFSHYLIRRFYILPAGQLVSFINSYAHYLKNNPLEIPKVPKIWEPWFEKTKQIFSENKQLIYNLDNLVYEKTLALAKISEELAEANHTKDKLFSIISHDLRSPMHSLSGILHLLKAKQIGEEDYEIVLNRLCLHFENTKAILENLLFWANSKIKGLPIEYKPFDLRLLLDDIIKTLSTLCERKRISIYNHIPESLIISSDDAVLKVCLQNIVSNAIKYSYERGSINIDIDILEDETLGISIKDSGTGISKDILQELNNNRYVKSTNGTNGEKGTGIGVMLCKDFLSSIKGTLKITSVEGVGSTFCIILPQEVYKINSTQSIKIIEGEILEYR